MAQHHRIIQSELIDDTEIYRTAEIHQCSVSDTVTVKGCVYIHDGYKIAAAIIEAYRYRGHSIAEQFEMIKNQIEEWDRTGNHS